ncbi:MAG: carbohydrate binding domain-containing protein [Candidatus Omnitrophota bacterium]
MRKSVVIFLFVLITGCSAGPKEVLIDGFEREIDKYTVDFGAAEGSKVIVSAALDKKTEGAQSLRIEYNLLPSGYMWVARGYGLDVAGAGDWDVLPENIEWKKYKGFSISMFGKATGGVIALDIKDSGGELWRFFLEDDFQGWKSIVCPFLSFAPRSDWQPDDADINDKLDFPIKSFQFEPRVFGEQEYYFDEVKLLKDING